MKTLSILLTLALVLCSCSGGGGSSEPPPPPTANDLINQGWQAFALQSYLAAAAKFDAAIGADPTLPDARNGAGWSYARLNRVDTALTRFTAGRTLDTNSVDLLAGLSVVQNARKQYLSSAQAGVSALAKNANWVFSRDTSVNTADLRLIMAEDYFALSDFAGSLALVRVYNPSFSPDIGTADGQTALAAEIERLRNALN
jgi:tetratricopeptide (TPR) repeat protein